MKKQTVHLSVKNINVYMLTPYYPPMLSGPSKQAHQVNKMLNKRGISITVITQKKDDETDNVEGIDVLRLPYKGLGGVFKTKKGALIWSLLTILHIIKNRKQIDVLHILESYYIAAIFSLVGFFIRKPVLVKSSIARGAIKKDKLHRKIRLFILKKMAKIIAISKETYQELIDHGFSKGNIFFIPNGVDTNLFSPVADDTTKDSLRNDLDFEKEHFYAIYVGLLNERKGINILLNAWKKVVIENPYVKLLLVGTFDSDNFKNWAMQFINDNKLTNNIELLGYRSNIEEFLKASDLFIFPSAREGLPNALMEAMASGLPCIARPIGGVTDLIDDKKSGLLCCGEGKTLVNNLIENIILLINNRDLRNQLGENARNTIVCYYSMENVSKKYKNLYGSLID